MNPVDHFSYCEWAQASATSPVHIRALGPKGRKLAGGVFSGALCGRQLAGGWDLPTDVPSTVEARVQIPQDQPGRLCVRCVERYESLTGTETGKPA